MQSSQSLIAAMLISCFAFTGCSADVKLDHNSPPHHTENGYRNYPVIEPADTQMLKLIWNRMLSSTKTHEIPEGHLLDEAIALQQFADLSKEDTVTWIGQSTTLLKLDGKLILTDPFFSDGAGVGPFAAPRTVPPGISADNLPAVDLIVVSHNHFDHLDANFIESLPNKENIVVLVPLGVGEIFRESGFTKIHELDWHQSKSVDGLQFTSHPMVHYSSRSLFDKNETLWCSWSIVSSNKKLFFAGDTAFSRTIFKDIGAESGGFDVALLPIGTYGNRKYGVNNHMTPAETLQVGLDLDAKTMVAIHWGTIDLSDEPLFEPPDLFIKAARDSQVDADRIWIMKAGETRALQ